MALITAHEAKRSTTSINYGFNDVEAISGKIANDILNNEQAMLEFDQVIEKRINKDVQKNIDRHYNDAYVALGLIGNVETDCCKIKGDSARLLKRWMFYYFPKYRVNNPKQFIKSSYFIKKFICPSIKVSRSFGLKVDDGLSKRWVKKLETAGYKVDFESQTNFATISWE